jgi:transcription initiation factor IIF auxiliary subunit
MALSIRQDTRYLGHDRWQWSVWLDGSSEELDQIDHIMYILDRTFHDPVREVSSRGDNFRLEGSTWGAFTLYAKAVYKDGHEISLQHDLALPHAEGTPTLA